MCIICILVYLCFLVRVGVKIVRFRHSRKFFVSVREFFQNANKANQKSNKKSHIEKLKRSPTKTK